MMCTKLCAVATVIKSSPVFEDSDHSLDKINNLCVRWQQISWGHQVGVEGCSFQSMVPEDLLGKMTFH